MVTIHDYWGDYAVSPVSAGSRIQCRSTDLDIGSATLPVASDTYRFKVITDCDARGFDDQAEVMQSMGALDCNGDGFIDKCQMDGTPNVPQLQDLWTDNGPGNAATFAPDGKLDCCQCNVPHTGDYSTPFCRGDQSTVCSNQPCPYGSADFNMNMTVGIEDIFAFLEAWFAGSPTADFNRRGGVELLDIFDFLQSWFNGCIGD